MSDATCAVTGCSRPIKSKGFCNAHYLRHRRHGSPTAGERLRHPSGLSLEERFRWFMPGGPPRSGCWDWTGSTGYRGYGQIHMDGAHISAHRTSYRLFVGPIPEGLEILHSCDRPICVQPAHLSPGTHQKNMAEASERGMLKVGRDRKNTKLSEDDVRKIRRLRASGVPQHEVARRFDISVGAVGHIIHRRTWTHLK